MFNASFILKWMDRFFSAINNLERSIEMKQVFFILLAALMVILNSKITNAQTDLNRQVEGELSGQMMDTVRNSSLQMNRQNEIRIRPINRELALQIVAEQIFKELNKTNDKLQITVQQTDNKSLKQSGKLADRIAKLSKRIRRGLNDGLSVPEVETAAIQYGDKSSQIRKLAENINDMIENVNRTKVVSLRTVNVNGENESSKQLELIESQALSLRTLARSKN